MRIDLEKALAEALSRHLPSDQVPKNLTDSIRYSLLAPGKRIRPRLSLACAEMLGLAPQAALPGALALEIIHCFTLIHDDLPCMDDDDFRRGKPSNHKVYGEAVALLAGDGLMAVALDVILEAAPHLSSPQNLVSGVKRLSWAMGPRGVIGGQAAEPLLTEHSTLEEMSRMHAKKTGALFEASLLIPKDFAGIADDSSEGRAIARFASELGLAFQIADDLDDADQERTEAGTYPPTSILHYLSADQARERSIQNLNQAKSGLQKIWSERASELASVADEVIRSL